MKEHNTNIIYKNIVFNKHALKTYKKNNGTATITVTSSLSYFYSSNNLDKKYSDIRKGAKIETVYIYIYDESKFTNNTKAFSIHCPNCGAPINSLGDSLCEYCQSSIKKINLKHWEISDFKEII